MQPVKIREPIEEQKCRLSSCGAFCAASAASQELKPAIHSEFCFGKSENCARNIGIQTLNTVEMDTTFNAKLHT